MKYCQNPRCHYYDSNDRLRGTGENKTYQTRKASKFYYGGGNFCTLNCQNDWFEVYGSRAVDYFGRITTPKKRNKNTQNYWQLRNQTVERLYGVDWNWDSNVDWSRVDQEINNIITQQNS